MEPSSPPALRLLQREVEPQHCTNALTDVCLLFVGFSRKYNVCKRNLLSFGVLAIGCEGVGSV